MRLAQAEACTDPHNGAPSRLRREGRGGSRGGEGEEKDGKDGRDEKDGGPGRSRAHSDEPRVPKWPPALPGKAPPQDVAILRLPDFPTSSALRLLPVAHGL